MEEKKETEKAKTGKERIFYKKSHCLVWKFVN